MLTFIVAMRARALSKNWAYHTWLLQRTVASLLAQTSPAFNVVIVCHDVPDIAGDARVHMLPVSFAVPQRTNDDMCADKVLKISKGVEWAQQRRSSYVMFVDADDLVSRRLAAYVDQHRGENGWYFHSGYVHTYGEPWVRAHAPHHLICGTGAIVRADLLRFDRSDSCRGEIVNTLANAGHNRYLPHLEAQGAPLRPLPFPGAIYVLHQDSTSEVPGGIGYRLSSSADRHPAWRRVLGGLRRRILTMPTYRPITPALRAEFTIPCEQGPL